MIRSVLLRARYVLLAHGTTIALVLLVVGTLSLGGAGWLYAHPQTTEVTDRTHAQTVRANVSTQAAVAADSSLYKPGRSLTNQPVYLRSETPSPSVVLTTTVPPDTRSTVDQRIVIRRWAERDGRTFWANSTVVTRTETTTRSGQVRTRTRLDLDAIRNHTEAVEQRVGEAGVVNVQLRLRVAYDTGRYNGTLTKPITIQIADDWYRIATPTVSNAHSIPVTSTVTVPGSGRGIPAGLGAVGGVAVLSGIVVGVGRRRGGRRMDPADVEFELHRLRYAPWISTGTLHEVLGQNVVHVASLEDLVDVGIDTNNRVIHDPTNGRYAVIDDATVYTFERR